MATNFNWGEDEVQPVSQVTGQPATNFNWDEDQIQPEAAPAEPQKPELNRVRQYEEKVKDYAGEAAGGLVRAAGGLEWLAAAGLETVYDAGRIIGREAYKGVTGTEESEMEPWKQTDYLTKNLKKAEGELLEKVLPEDRDTLGKVIGRVAEYAAPTTAMTRIFTQKGAELLAKPASELAEKGLKRKFQDSMMAAARDPKAAAKMEQGVSAVMATVGQISEEMGVSKGWQIPIELVTGILTGTIANKASTIKDWISTNTSKASLTRFGEQRAAAYLQEVAKHDPEFMTKLKRGLELQDETGVKMNLAQLTDNPELRMAVTELELAKPGGSTHLDAILAEQTQQIKAIAPRDVDAQAAGQAALVTEREAVEAGLEATATKAIDDVFDEVDRLAPTDRVAAGETGQTMLNNARDAMEANVGKLYAEVGNPTLQTDEIVKGLNKAKNSPLKGDEYLHELDAEIKGVLEKNILGFEGDKVIKAPKKDIKLRGKAAAPKEITLDQARLIESRLKERIRIANAAGEKTKARVLNQILDGIFNQYKATKGVDSAQIGKLREAATASKKYHELFNQGEVLLASKVDVQGMEKITTEGFVRNFIKPNSDVKGARTEEAVENFYNAYGNMPEARNWMANSFGALLKEQIPDIANANQKVVQSFINRHSKFLKKAGISDRFNTVTKAIKQSQDANAAMKLDHDEFVKSSLGKFMNTDDPIKEIAKSIENRSFGKIMASANRIKNKPRRELILRGIRETVWDGVLSKMSTTQRVAGEQVLDTGILRKALDNPEYAKILNQALGKEHTKNLNSMLDLIERIAPFTRATAGLPKEHVDEKIVEKLMTGLRAAAHGFVRPDLIAVQMGVRGMKAITVKESHRVLKEALDNPEFAQKLLKLKTTPEGRRVIKTMFSPLLTSVVTKADEE